MRALRSFFLIAATLALAACSTTPVNLNYKAPSDAAPVAAHPIIAVGSFTDQRKHESNWLGAIRGGYGNPLKTLQTPASVKDVVRKAFADGLAARGLLSNDASAPYTMTGVVRQFDCNQYVRREAHADVQITLAETGTGKTLFSQEFKRDNVEGSLLALNVGIFASVEDLQAVATRTLQETVDEALNSLELKRAIQLSKNASAGVVN